VPSGLGLDWTGLRWDGMGTRQRERHGMFPFSDVPMGMGIGYSKVTLERDSLAGGQPPDATTELMQARAVVSSRPSRLRAMVWVLGTIRPALRNLRFHDPPLLSQLPSL
jgi:hypothetical protein